MASRGLEMLSTRTSHLVCRDLEEKWQVDNREFSTRTFKETSPEQPLTPDSSLLFFFFPLLISHFALTSIVFII